MDQVTFRTEPVEEDKAKIRSLLQSSGFFHPWEIDIAIELIDDRLAKGAASEYLFLFAESAGQVAGYACYGPVTMAKGRFELYWIAVDAARRGQGIGRLLLGRAQAHMRELGGKYVLQSFRMSFLMRHFYAASSVSPLISAAEADIRAQANFCPLAVGV